MSGTIVLRADRWVDIDAGEVRSPAVIVVDGDRIAAVGPAEVGTANVSAKSTGSARAPIVMKRRREPVRARSRSDPWPMNGSTRTSHTFAPVTTTPASAAGTASASVR